MPAFDPAKPSELLYDGTRPDSKIVGLSYLVFHPGGAPEGFAGPNDHWHQHNANGGLCLEDRTASSSARADVARASARRIGGAQGDADRHLDAARLGRARLGVQLGRVRR